MYNFNGPTYTGEDSAAKFPELKAISDSVQRNGDLQIRGAEMQLAESLKKKERMIKNMEIIPVSIANDVLMNRQALGLEKYKNDLAAISVRAGGIANLTAADEMEAVSLKNKLNLDQEKLLSQAKIAEGIEAALKNDTRNYFAKEYGYDRLNKWRINPDKNPLDASALKVRPQDVARELEKDKWIGDTKDDTEDVLDSKGKPTGMQQQYTTLRSKPQAQERMMQALFSNEAYLEGVLDRFNKQTEDKVAPYFENWDGNGDGKVDPSDKKYAFENMDAKDNPIMQWYLNDPYYLDRGMGKVKGRTIDTRVKAKTTYDWSTPVTDNHNQNDVFQEQKNVYGYQSYYNLGRKSFTSDPQMIGSYKDHTTGQTKTLNKATRFEVVGYGADKDELLVKIVDDVKGDKVKLKQGTLVTLDASKYDDLLKAKPFGLNRETLRKNITAQAGELDVL